MAIRLIIVLVFAIIYSAFPMADDPPISRERRAALQQKRMIAAHATATVMQKKQTRIIVTGNARSRFAELVKS